MSDALSIATALCVEWEGFSATPYQDTAGVWTIGYGATWIGSGHVGPYTAQIDEPTGRSMLEATLAPTCDTVRRLMAGEPDEIGLAQATENEVGACTSFAYNEGLRAFAGSTLLHLWLAGDASGAADQFGRWIYDRDPVTHQLVEVAGLVNRRTAERAVFISG